MEFVEKLKLINPDVWLFLLVILNFVFLIAWAFDSKEHGRLKSVNISDKEFLTHRLILIPSLLMEFSLVLMFWYPLVMLPFFIAFYLVRTVHEFIDELHFHVTRCEAKESYLHLVMWCSVHVKTWIMFVWGFFLQYDGILTSNIYLIGLYFFILFGLGLITMIEFKR